MKPYMRSLPIIALITAESLSLLGNQIAAVAIPLLVLQFTHSPMMTGIASAGNILPIIIAAILGGRFIDRFGAWNISVAADLLSFFSTLALPFVFLYLHTVSPLLIFLLVFLGALFDPTGIAARQTLVPGLTTLSGTSLHRMNSWRGSLENGADFLGPVIGVACIGMAGIINTFFINAATFLLCALLFSIAVPRKRAIASTDVPENGFSGISFIRKHPQIRALAVVGMSANFVILPFLSLLLPVLAIQKFGSTALLGVCLSIFGLAATVGAASFSWLSRRFSNSVIYYGGLFMTGIAIVLCAFSSHPYEVVLSVGLAGLFLGAGNPLQQTILHQSTPEAIAGKVFTSLTAIHFVAGPLGLLLAGIAIEYSTIVLVLQTAGGLLVLIAIFGWYALSLNMVQESAVEI